MLQMGSNTDSTCKMCSVGPVSPQLYSPAFEMPVMSSSASRRMRQRLISLSFRNQSYCLRQILSIFSSANCCTTLWQEATAEALRFFFTAKSTIPFEGLDISQLQLLRLYLRWMKTPLKVDASIILLRIGRKCSTLTLSPLFLRIPKLQLRRLSSIYSYDISLGFSSPLSKNLRQRSMIQECWWLEKKRAIVEGAGITLLKLSSLASPFLESCCSLRMQGMASEQQRWETLKNNLKLFSISTIIISSGSCYASLKNISIHYFHFFPSSDQMFHPSPLLPHTTTLNFELSHVLPLLTTILWLILMLISTFAALFKAQQLLIIWRARFLQNISD